MVDAKADAYTTCIRKALEHENVTLKRNVKINRLLTDDSGKRVTEVEGEENGKKVTLMRDKLSSTSLKIIWKLTRVSKKN